MNYWGWVAIGVLLLLSACSTTTANVELTPPQIYYGETLCEFCGMIISEERFAAGYITEDGQERVFDDIGDMVQAHQTRQEAVLAFFVHDINEVVWMRAEKAYYVRSEGLASPMLSGLEAYRDRATAESRAIDMGGKILTFEELLAHKGFMEMSEEHTSSH